MDGLIFRRESDGRTNSPVAPETPLPVALYTADGSGALAATTSALPVTGPIAAATTTAANVLPAGAKYNATLPTYTDGQWGELQITPKGNLRITIASSGGAAADTASVVAAADASASVFGLVVTSRNQTFNGATWDRTVKPNATSRILSAAASTNATSAKAAAGNLHTVHGYNAAAAVRYLKFYNKASAPTVGTDTPVMTLAIGASQTFRFDFGGHYFSTGIAYALTTGVADADTGALTAADILGLSITYS